MSELTAADTLVAQTGADALLSQLIAGMLTPDEYHQAIVLVAPMVEGVPACLYCDRSAIIGQTCADHADRAAVIRAARESRPSINLARYSTRASLTAAVIAALERSGRVRPAQRFAARAAKHAA
jgi:hypothetical protein